MDSLTDEPKKYIEIGFPSRNGFDKHTVMSHGNLSIKLVKSKKMVPSA